MSQLFSGKDNRHCVLTHLKHAKGMSLRYGVVVLSDLHHSLVLFVGDSGGGVGENH